MSSSVLHHCTYCGHDSEISSSLASFAENPYCRQCGLSAAEGDSKMQDDLAALFARQMSVASIRTPNPNPASPPQSGEPAVTFPTPDMSPSSPSPLSTSISRPIVYNISQHYHHSAHQLPGLRTWSTLPATLHDLQQAGIPAEEMLLRSKVDPTTLFPSQLTLFTQADLEQKARLIELWQISRPTAGNPISLRAFGNSDVIPASSPLIPSSIHVSSDAMNEVDSMDQDATVTGGVGNGVDTSNQQAEPYVMSGYEALAQREYKASAARDACEHAFAEQSQSSVAAAAGTPTPTPTSASYKPAVDPVYKGHDWWGQQDQQQRHGQHGQGPSDLLLQPMENQYGAFEQRSNTIYMGCGVRRAHWLEDQEML
ncbi:hypothetical protein AJ78_01411 [Emergomyces pasteurianus Ep9510]|uniref:Uncharacterized protein n=1 Tax=Emergomyces pasteurianus Ep9510 TaxID=1447872 RepID=A0A1J9PRM5_9EURO|nr:hypothetical protein AJ78_01411 [Emergomyces pasteurianus Ep9510]